ncbi:MAG: DUF1501 domain-containing protein [Verrucomicrobiota bacterium]|nr:DUF1501 domain-containing protein [Verrucomicrobiota bacterium]
MLTRCSTGFGMLALQGLMASPAFAGTARRSHFRPRAKQVILCYMSGGVSQVDSFDPKPKLRELHGKPMPVKIERTQFNNNGNVMASPFEFRQHGQSGIPVSSMFPHVAESVDELAVIRSMTSKVNEHAQGNYAFHTGFPIMGHPSAGAWVSYGLGTENRNLPGFVVLQAGGAAVPHGGVGLFSNGYLPGQYQGSIIVGDKSPAVRNVRPREADATQRSRLDFVKGLDADFVNRIGGNNDVEAAVRNYETAYRMQASVPELCDLRGETAATKKLYGMDSPNGVTAAYGHQALLARRLVERGVRFVELSCLPEKMGGGQAPNPWDQHGNLKGGHENMSLQVDQPIGGLLKDLKVRGLLDDTLVIWAGEFGRTPFSQGSNGRDHNPYGYSVWLAGGGVKGGTIYGATDELGYHVTENKCDIYDLWATVLYLMGLDHEELTYRHGGRDLRLTDVHGAVIRGVIS